MEELRGHLEDRAAALRAGELEKEARLVIIAVPAVLKLFPTNSTQAEGAVI